MSDFKLAPGQALLVASRGTAPEHGLTRWVQRNGAWHGTRLATVNQLSSLARHPTLPVVYGTSRVDDEGDIHAWRIDGDKAVTLGEKSSEGAEPCHIVVDPPGRLLLFANYTTSTIGVQRLDAGGGFDGPVDLVRLTGSGPETERQEAAHPHQLFFAGDTLFVIDLGADLVLEFTVDAGRAGAAALKETRRTAVPAGAGPRHGVMLPDGRLAISGELGSSLLVGRPGDAPEAWANVPSTRRTGPAKTRHTRNYPGDIQRSPDGRHVYFANRGYDTISTFDVTGRSPVLVSEIDSTVAWPQHLIATADSVLVAGWDSSAVRVLPLDRGRPSAALPLFDCAGAGWLLLWD
ncbi:MAG: lactonase family protein [Pseudomonadota bacterium]